jgi:hypothetical protein
MKFIPTTRALIKSFYHLALLLYLAQIEVFAQTTCTPPPNGLVSWWRGESNAVDSVSGNLGTVHGGVSIVPGKVGNGFGFDGTGYIVISNSPALNFTDQLSIELWYLSSQPSGTYYTIIDKRVGAAIANYGINDAPNGLGVFYDDPTVEDGDDTPYGSNFEVSRYSPAPSPGVFHHLAATYQQLTNNQVELQTFVDGQLVRTRVILGNLANTINSSPITIGAAVQGSGEFFIGTIDEISIYDRTLSLAEVQAIYNAGSSGKCPTDIGPSFVQQPLSQNAVVGNNVTLAVIAAGSLPLAYQWEKDGGILSGATQSSLTLTKVQLSDSGAYSVVVSNGAGSVTSVPANLSIGAAPLCQAPPAGLVGWWKGDGNANNSVGGNNGSMQNGVSLPAGEVGQAFGFNGINQFVQIQDAPALNPTNALTIETWVYVSGNPNTDVAVVAAKQNPNVIQYQLLTHYTGNRLVFRPIISVPSGLAYFDGNAALQFNTWYHVAMTYDGASLRLYVNGTLDGGVAASGPIVATGQALYFGGLGTGPWFFNGRVDEVSLYSRALSVSEIQAIYNAGSAGKCVGTIAPSLVTQPQGIIATIGGNATFNVGAAGSIPLSYQWQFNGNPLAGATNSSLTLSNVLLSSAGPYSVVVTNAAGSITSSVATLTVTLPPAAIQVGAANVASDGTVSLPINLVANGNENAVGFTLNFDPTVLTNTGIVLGSNAVGASLFPNSTHAAAGQLGVAVGLPAGNTFGAGTQQLVIVSFNSPIVTTATSNTINFSDSVVQRVLADVSGKPLPATFTPGTVILPPSQLEGDSFPRPNGDGQLNVSDWVLIGRYVAGLDSPTNALEFQKADCAPRETLGDGALTVSDWVQAGRYVAGLDPIARVGGPTSAVPLVVTAPTSSAITRKTMSSDRQLRLLAPTLTPGQTGTIAVELGALGNENALSFSLNFDPAILIFTGATTGNAVSVGTLNVNDKQASEGHLAMALALAVNQTFAAGSKQVVQVSFRASAIASGNTSVAFSDQPVPRGVSDPNAVAVEATYVDATIQVNPKPVLKILAAGKSINLSWPASADGFVLQESSDAKLSAGSWTTVATPPTIMNNENVISVPSGATNTFYRLYHP